MLLASPDDMLVTFRQYMQVNKVQFSARGLALLEGALTITAGYERASPTRVNITFQSASLVRRVVKNGIYAPSNAGARAAGAVVSEELRLVAGDIQPRGVA